MKITDIINQKNEINVNVKDLDIILSHRGFAYIDTLKCKNLNECLRVFKNLNISPKGLFMNIKTNPNVSLYEIQKFIDNVYEVIDDETDAIFGVKYQENENVEVEILCTGINLK
jgi:cell division GTPase FtsZ